MVEVGFFVWLGWIFLALIGLAIGLSVLRNIVREARERNPAEPTTPETNPEPSPPDDFSGRVCSNCQTVNDPSFRYCSECAAKL